MITPSFALTATERVLPRMALDFTTASLDSRVTFTRSGNTATVVNSSGYVAPINADLPRFDYDPITLACKGLLIEEARTNLLLYSAAFNTTWVPSNATISTNNIVSPDNASNGDTLIPNNGVVVGNAVIAQTVAKAATATTYTYSCFAKQNGLNSVALYIRDGLTANNRATVTILLTNGTISTAAAAFGTFSAASASVKTFANGWYNVQLTFTTSTEISLICRMYTVDSVITVGDGVKGVAFWGAQLEANAFGTSYIPTVASTVTRNADVVVMTGTNFSSWYTATTGAAVVWAIPQTATGTRPLLQFDDTTANEIISLRGNVADPELYIVDGGAPQAQIDVGTIVANTAYKLSGAWNTNSCTAAKDGGTVGTDNTATIPTPTQLRIGSDGTNYASAWVQKILYYPQRIIDAEVQAISK